MKTIILLISFFGLQLTTFGQLSLSLNMTFEPDPDVLNWAANPATVQLTVTNSSEQTFEYKILGKINFNGQIVLDIDPSKMPTEGIGPFETKVAFAEDLFPERAVKLYGNIKETYTRTNALPGGYYQICTRIIDLQGNELSPDNCRPFQITSYQQPSLIFPTSSSTVSSLSRPLFSWTQVVPTPAFPVNYRVRVVEVPENLRSLVPTDEPGYHKEPRWGSKEWMPKIQAIQSYGGSITEYEWAVGTELFYREDRTVTGVWKKIVQPAQTIDKGNAIYNAGQLSGDALRALNYGFPIIDVEISGQTQFQWPLDLPDPIPGHYYVWSVKALRSDNDLPVGDNNGLSQPEQFFVIDESADTNNPSSLIKAPDFIIADENGCLYGCTGNVWEPIDCPAERSFTNPYTYPISFLLASTEEGSEKKWLLLDETTEDALLTKGPMLPAKRFKLTDQGENSNTRIAASSQYIDPKTAIITCGGGIKLCWQPPPQGCVVVSGDEPCPDIMGNYLIDVVTTPNIVQTITRTNKQPEVTLEQIQPFIVESVKTNEPFFLSLNNDGTLTHVRSTVECTGDYCIVISGKGPNGSTQIQAGDPPTFCYRILKADSNSMTLMKVEDPVLCNLKFKVLDIDLGTIVLRNADSSICLKIDGTIAECRKLPSANELNKAAHSNSEDYKDKIQEIRSRRGQGN